MDEPNLDNIDLTPTQEEELSNGKEEDNDSQQSD